MTPTLPTGCVPNSPPQNKILKSGTKDHMNFEHPCCALIVRRDGGLSTIIQNQAKNGNPKLGYLSSI
jgi:putative IMPACT (imprinted ancient) family translation regulator